MREIAFSTGPILLKEMLWIHQSSITGTEGLQAMAFLLESRTDLTIDEILNFDMEDIGTIIETLKAKLSEAAVLGTIGKGLGGQDAP